MLQNKADINCNNNGLTALNHAAMHNQTDMVKFLLLKKANVNAKGKSNKTALITAVNCQNVRMVKALIAYKADINAKDNDNKTPFNYAVTKLYGFWIPDILIAKGAGSRDIIDHGQDYLNYIDNDIKKILNILRVDFPELKKMKNENEDLNKLELFELKLRQIFNSELTKNKRTAAIQAVFKKADMCKIKWNTYLSKIIVMSSKSKYSKTKINL